MLLLKNRIQSISCFCAFLILFQSCRVYNSEFVSLNDAVAERKRVKIKTKDGETLKFKQIIKDTNQFYGLLGKDKLLISENNISSVRLHNKTWSVILTMIAVSVTGMSVALAVIFTDISRGAGSLSSPSSTN